MARSSSASASSRLGAGRWVIIGLIALALFDVVLIGFALGSNRASAGGAASRGAWAVCLLWPAAAALVAVVSWSLQ